MTWYVIYTKPKQEQRALQNLIRQGYDCYFPTLPVEKLQQGTLVITLEPLFPRYLFIQINTAKSGKSWGPIRSTKGVSHLVTFGTEPAKVADHLIATLRSQAEFIAAEPQRLFTPGEIVQITEGPFTGIEGIYQMTDGKNRAMVLIELLNKPTQLGTPPTSLRKTN